MYRALSLPARTLYSRLGTRTASARREQYIGVLGKNKLCSGRAPFRRFCAVASQIWESKICAFGGLLTRNTLLRWGQYGRRSRTQNSLHVDIAFLKSKITDVLHRRKDASRIFSLGAFVQLYEEAVSFGLNLGKLERPKFRRQSCSEANRCSSQRATLLHERSSRLSRVRP